MALNIQKYWIKKIFKDCMGLVRSIFSPESKKCKIKWDVDWISTQKFISMLTIGNADCDALSKTKSNGEISKDIVFLCYSDKKNI